MRVLVVVYIGSLLITTAFAEFDITHFPYQGCYEDQIQRTLTGDYVNFRCMTREMCLDHCKRRIFKFCGLQNGTSCYCGDELPLPDDKKSDSECNVTCPGEITATCGGTWRNAIFSTGEVPYVTEYVGCYLDEANRRFTGYNENIPSNSLRTCIHRCRRLCYKYAALQNGTVCSCGDNEPNCWERKNDCECNIDCPLDHATKCGGVWRNSVYKTLVARTSSCVYNSTDFTYVGCYVDSAQKRRLRGVSITSNSMTRQMCCHYCKFRSYKYAGLQNGTLCRCGNEDPCPSDLGQDIECNSDCSGDQSTKCGGCFRNAIYRTGQLTPNYTYVGCYLDLEGHRKLKGYCYLLNEMTPSDCIGRCNFLSYRYAGLQNGTECYCGNTVLQDADKRDDGECNTACAGDDTKVCGGSLRNSIYQTSEIIEGKTPLASVH